MRFTKLPRALRFNDRISMRASTELREPFLDHRLVELALRQPLEHKLNRDVNKWMLRRIVHQMLPVEVVEAPKRPVQTPQREWLRGPLKPWVETCIATALAHFGGGWLERGALQATWESYCGGQADNSFFVWQWISLVLAMEDKATIQSCPK